MSRRQRRARLERRRLTRVAGTGAAVGGVAAVATLLSGSVAEAAANCEVTNLDGASTMAGSLGYEMEQASMGDCAGNTVTFASNLSGTIGLSMVLPVITRSGETIVGPGSGQVTIKPSGAALGSPVFKTFGAASAAISGLTITGASATSGPAVYNSAGTALTLNDLTVTNSQATSNDGGAIYSQQGAGTAVTIEHSTLDDNDSGLDGGAIFSQAPLTITDSTVNDNRSTSFGGGVYGVGGLTLERTTVSGNVAGLFAGGLLAAGTVVITDSTISDDTSLGNIGGVFAGPGTGGPLTFTMTDSTVADNRADHEAGMYLGRSTAPLTVQGSTITGNVATAEFGGIYTYANTLITDTLDLDSSVVAGNTAPLYSDLYSGAVAGDHAFIGDPTGVTFVSQSHDIMGTASNPANPLLGPLAANGGPVQTELPQAGSPLIDAGKAFGESTDARGLARDVLLLGPAPAGGDGTDIGAAELQAAEAGAPTVTAVTPAGGGAGTSVTVTGTNLFTASAVSFGGVPASFTAVSATELVATVPSGPSGTVDVLVTTPAGMSAGGAGDRFIYPPAPGGGSSGGGGSGSTTTNPTPTTSTPAISTPPPPPTVKPAASSSSLSASFGNQRLTLTAPNTSSCTARTASAKVTFSSTATKSSKGAKLKLSHVDFYIDKGVAHRATKKIDGKKKTTTTYKPNATSKKASVTESLKLKGLKSGNHTLKVTAFYSKTTKVHGKTKTSTTSKTLRTTLKVC